MTPSKQLNFNIIVYVSYIFLREKVHFFQLNLFKELDAFELYHEVRQKKLK